MSLEFEQQKKYDYKAVRNRSADGAAWLDWSGSTDCVVDRSISLHAFV
jgi:hypothetical protein